MSAPAQEKPQVEKQARHAKFVQIASGQPIGQGLVVYALDEDGNVWQNVVGRQDEWLPLPRKRGLPESR